MFSLSYLPTAERLTVVIVKARNLRFQNDKDSGDPFVKVNLHSLFYLKHMSICISLQQKYEYLCSGLFITTW